MADKNDIHLFTSIRDGDHQAFKVFYHENWKSVFSATFRLCGSEEMTKDLVQEGFIQVWENRTGINPSLNLTSYLFRTIKNNFLNQIQREKRFEKKVEVILLNNHPEVSDAHEHLVAEELQYQLEAAVSHMPSGMRNIWQLSRDKYLTIDEISRDLSISPLTVKKQLSNALRLLRSRLHLQTEK